MAFEILHCRSDYLGISANDSHRGYRRAGNRLGGDLTCRRHPLRWLLVISDLHPFMDLHVCLR